jgi:hypothetical protein
MSIATGQTDPELGHVIHMDLTVERF